MYIKNFEELEQIQATCTAALSGKFSGEGHKRAIVLCGGTGCLSSMVQILISSRCTCFENANSTGSILRARAKMR